LLIEYKVTILVPGNKKNEPMNEQTRKEREINTIIGDYFNFISHFRRKREIADRSSSLTIACLSVTLITSQQLQDVIT
jgi:hypothetical protein